jgi:hypothetical protein
LYQYRLRIKSIKTKEDLEKLSDLLNYFDLEDAITRYKETKTLFDFGLKHVVEPSLKLPMEFFLEGIKSYFLGFNEATIFYSSLSVELMLLHKVGKKFREKEDSKIPKSMTFWWLIHKTNILDPEHVTTAEKLNRIRNCYVHLQNEILYSRVRFEEDRKFLETYEDKKLPKQMKDLIIKDVKILQEFLEEIFPSLPSSVSRKNVEFMKTRYELYWKWLQKEMKWTTSKLLEAGPQEVMRTTQGRFDALDALNWSKSLLEFCIRHK